MKSTTVVLHISFMVLLCNGAAVPNVGARAVSRDSADINPAYEGQSSIYIRRGEAKDKDEKTIYDKRDDYEIHARAQEDGPYEESHIYNRREIVPAYEGEKSIYNKRDDYEIHARAQEDGPYEESHIYNRREIVPAYEGEKSIYNKRDDYEIHARAQEDGPYEESHIYNRREIVPAYEGESSIYAKRDTVAAYEYEKSI